MTKVLQDSGNAIRKVRKIKIKNGRLIVHVINNWSYPSRDVTDLSSFFLSLNSAILCRKTIDCNELF